jgi:GDP-L-fucose synthase
VAATTSFDRVYVAGHRGLVGSAIWRRLEAEGAGPVGRSSAELDLRDREATLAFFDEQRPGSVYLAAARVGGIVANSTEPVEFLSDNLRIQLNVLEAAKVYGTKRLLFLGSSCIYPKFAPQPIPEDAILTGPLEPTNDAYAIAKLAGVLHIQALRREYGLRYISAMPTNLYGPGDNFDLEKSHVLPAMIRKFHDANATGATQVILWGDGSPRREFLHVDDLADACLMLLDAYDDDRPINVGVGDDIAVRDLADLVAEIVGFEGDIIWDTTRPNGTPRKLLDVSRLQALGWKPRISLREGIAATYRWFLASHAEPAEAQPS